MESHADEGILSHYYICCNSNYSNEIPGFTYNFHFDYIIYMLSIRSVNVDKKVNSPKLTFVSVTGYLGNAALTFQLA